MRKASGIGSILRVACALIAATTSLSANALSFLPWENTRIFYESFTHDGIRRDVAFIAPRDAGANAPAVVVLHFNLGTAPSMANLTEVGEFARDFGAWVILPVAHDLTWSHAPNDTDPTDDVGFLAALIDDSVARFRLDAKRIYMTGYSQGGNMTVRFACERPEKIAAGASVAATMRDALARQCAPSIPTPMVFFNGTADKQVPYGTGLPSLIRDLTLVGSLPAQDAAKYWAEINGCTGNAVRTDLPTPVADTTRVYLDSYNNCPPNRGAAIYTIENGGHTWPGVLDFVPVAGITTQNLRANRAMWEFFQRFSR